ncbi:MAG: thiol-disulfide isomerase, partial [Acidobacteriia bacterium]|nr:thiol-disulfide isomerase [Terriglobia bacterium]
MRTSARLAGLLLAALAVDAAPVTFYRDVLPILQENCQSCHRPGEAAPMPFLTYENTRPWAKAIKRAVLARQMPPWNADTRYGDFRNERKLSAEAIEILAAWVDGGALEGDLKDAPPPVSWRNDWEIEPDKVIALPELPVPARGTVELTDVVVPTDFARDAWISSIEIRPGNRAVVHHVIVSVLPHHADADYGVPHTEQKKRDAEGAATERIPPSDRLRGLVGVEAVYVPGAEPMNYGMYGAAMLLPGGSDLLVQIHYTPNGTATTDQTKIGFTFGKQEPAQKFVTVGPTALRDAAHFHIPAGDPNWETHTELVFTADARLVWFLPHMHLRGKDMTYRLRYPNGESKTLLSVKWDFNWQMAYEAAKSIPVPKGSRLEVTAHFDNSINNRFNPDPKVDVWWGDQTWEEMMVPWFGV